MNYFLAKTEPSTYSIDDLDHDGQTVWNGIHSYAALKFMREMKAGDLVFVYHSGGESCIVGLMKVVQGPRVDPNDEKSWIVDVEFRLKYDEPVTLKEIKQSHKFDDWSLVRQGRLSTMPVPEKFVKWMKEKGYKVQ